MNFTFFLIVYLLNITGLESVPLVSHCPCRSKPKSYESKSCFYQQAYFKCGCGGGGGGADNQEIPADQG